MDEYEALDRAGPAGYPDGDPGSTGFRRFILDPKTSVKTYIAESLVGNPYDHPQGSQAGGVYNHQAGYTGAPLSNPHGHVEFPQPNLYGPNNEYGTPYADATNPSSVYPGQQQQQQHHPQAHPSRQGTPALVQLSSYPNPPEQVTTSHARYGPAPPPPDAQGTIACTTGTYHRMALDFETLKTVFFMAKADPHHVDLSPAAARLKSLAREIWTLRFEHAEEFEYSDVAQEQIITAWKIQFEFWSDVLEDLMDPVQSKKDAVGDVEKGFLHLVGFDALAAGTTPANTTPKKAPVPSADKLVKKVAATTTATTGEVAATATPAVKKVVAKPAVKKVVAKPAATE